MGRSWAEESSAAREVYEQADEVLGLPLSDLCWNGPEEELQLTANAQPALLATAAAILRGVGDLGLDPVAMAGHSLGEYAALVAADSLRLEDALLLVRRRGEFMQEAVPVGEGAMAAILGMGAAEVTAVTAETRGEEVCAVANLNAPGQTVIAGHTRAVERAMERCKEEGARRAVRLPVSAPFHSPLMAPAREQLTPFLDQTSFSDPAVPVVCNIDAQPTSTGDDARKALIRQIDGPVRWVASVAWITEHMQADLFVEVGPGKVLTGLNRQNAPQAKTVSLSEPSGLHKLEEVLSQS
jgi:[acyl-carrier-protein] S-malonyltransferase